ncbi:hypothetical protein Z957_12350 [Clostridium sp. K25]|uniref:Uncharacterized protein n=1 Tax=Clostridium novyi B str. ATCC 27606 TaxID=1443123 RepID=A0AA40IVT9_CLONO|nr:MULTISPECIES: hypothetical protein [Clostridium]KEI10831.1 hypothetical protein Z957_12350 [Clostridium sp. K25]KEI17792.1 hypothetical protein Z959_05985 [Clostridium novyi B str. ATCC 27606]
MSIISRKRIINIKKELEKKIGKEEYTRFIIRAKNGLFLIDLTKKPIYSHIKKEIPGLEIEDCLNCNMEDIIVAGDGTMEPVIICMDMPDDEEIEKAIRKVKADNTKESKLNFEDVSTEELIKIVDYYENQ